MIGVALVGCLHPGTPSIGSRPRTWDVAVVAATGDRQLEASYVLDLERVEFDSEPSVFAVHLDDRAGNVHSERLALELVLEPLRIERAALSSGTFAGGRWSLLAGAGAALALVGLLIALSARNAGATRIQTSARKPST